MNKEKSKKRISLLQTTTSYLWSIFLNGLFAILPFAVTVALFTITFRFVTTWLEPLRPYIPPNLVNLIPYAEVVGAIIFIFLFGTFLKLFLLRRVVHVIEDVIKRLPLIRPIYSGVKQLVIAFSAQDKVSFKQVVLVEFPRKGIYSIGFQTSQLLPEIAPDRTQKYFNIFIPTTPNPTSGYFIVVPEEQIFTMNITRQEAMAMIISGGIIQPEQNENNL